MQTCPFLLANKQGDYSLLRVSYLAILHCAFRLSSGKDRTLLVLKMAGKRMRVCQVEHASVIDDSRSLSMTSRRGVGGDHEVSGWRSAGDLEVSEWP